VIIDIQFRYLLIEFHFGYKTKYNMMKITNTYTTTTNPTTSTTATTATATTASTTITTST